MCLVNVAGDNTSHMTAVHQTRTTATPLPGAWETFALDQMWLFVPLQRAIADFLSTIPNYPFQMGSSLSASGINYDLFRRAGAMERLKSIQKQLEELGPGAH